MERITPFKGYWVAACTLPMGELGEKFIGYAKASSTKPRSCWEGPAEFEHSGESVFDGEAEAIARAEQAVRDKIERGASKGLPKAQPAKKRARREGPSSS